MKLTKKREKFCKEYVKLDNASDAYRRSYNASKMSNKTINECASKLLANPKIAARVSELQRIAAEVLRRNSG
ncbi:terminase small subunit [Aquimarina hainanensis]|uniref:terminase small subunit n=1 Tax=Aquimarina hainanensis TaxID=1578017 RepID=UPI003619622D